MYLKNKKEPVSEKLRTSAQISEFGLTEFSVDQYGLIFPTVSDFEFFKKIHTAITFACTFSNTVINDA